MESMTATQRRKLDSINERQQARAEALHLVHTELLKLDNTLRVEFNPNIISGETTVVYSHIRELDGRSLRFTYDMEWLFNYQGDAFETIGDVLYTEYTDRRDYLFFLNNDREFALREIKNDPLVIANIWTPTEEQLRMQELSHDL